MAPPAAEVRGGFIARLVDQLRSRPGRLEFALRLALVCTLTTLVTEIYQTPDPALTTYLAFFVMKADRVESVVIGVVLLILITVIIGTVILVSMVVADEPLGRVASIAVISFCLLFTTSASKLRPFGSTIALIVAYALDLLGTAHIGEIVTRALLYAWLFVGIPAGVSIAVNLLLGPAPRRPAERALAHRLKLAAARLRTPDAGTQGQFEEALAEGTEEIRAWLRMAALEKTSPLRDLEALTQATEAITPILLLVDVATDHPQAALPATAREHIADTLGEMTSILDKGGYPINVAFDYRLDPAASPEAAATVKELTEALNHFTVKFPDDLPVPSVAKASGGFFLADAFTNPTHVYYALKTTAAAMFCYITYILLDWPGIHTCFLTCYIVSLGTTAETVEKLTLRIGGALLGAVAGYAALVYLMPGIDSIGGLMTVVFLATVASGWVGAGGPRISYAGFQIAFAFFLCVIQGSSPAFDLTTARDRVIGILFGNLAVYLVSVNIWPASLARGIDPAIAALLRRLGAVASAGTSARRFSCVSEATTALGALEQDLALIGYEPRSIRPPLEWVETRRRAANEMEALEGRLLICGDLAEGECHEVASRLDSIAGSVERHENRSAAGPSLGQLDALLGEHLMKLEQALAGVADHAPA